MSYKGISKIKQTTPERLAQIKALYLPYKREYFVHGMKLPSF
ncbi:MAG: hypothetical protein V1709_03480 [Planctomycetota bacterium]